jgi:hypothetical protein
MPNSKIDSTGRTLLDHVADIGTNAPESLRETHQAFIALYNAGWTYTEWSIDAAIRTGNHRLLRWLQESRCAQRDDILDDANSSWVKVRTTLEPEKFAWCAVHSRNAFALRYCWLRAEHFEYVALEGNTAFLGRMLQAHHQRNNAALEPISILPFLFMLDEYEPDEQLPFDTVAQAHRGFRWLLRNRMIDLDTVNSYHAEQIAEIYGDHARLLLTP